MTGDDWLDRHGQGFKDALDDEAKSWRDYHENLERKARRGDPRRIVKMLKFNADALDILFAEEMDSVDDWRREIDRRDEHGYEVPEDDSDG